METRTLLNGMVELVADPGRRLHRKDTDIYVAKAPVPAGQVSEWEETDSVPAYTRADYVREVERLIALRYTTGQEIQFAREQDAAGDSYRAYLAYVESCKAQALANLTAGSQTDESPEI